MGPLAGVRVIELAGLGPGPMAGMLLADMGADVLRIDRPGATSAVPPDKDVVQRGKTTLPLNLKDADDLQTVRRLIACADVLIEGFRPGVTERLGLGPQECLALRPSLIYGRATGWGQDGPLAQAAGHDINYIALAGVLASIGRAGQPPTPPLNLIGDYGGGALYLALGIAAALFEARSSGRGQVVDAAMIDGAASLMAKACGNLAAGQTTLTRGTNLLDSGAPFYDVYECADGGWMAVGAIEPQFHAALLERLGIDTAGYPPQWDRERWPEARAILQARFRSRSRAQWCAEFEGSDACVSPVLSLAEAPGHAHNTARQTFIDVGGVMQPAPAPRFSRSSCATPRPPGAVCSDAAAVLADWSQRGAVGGPPRSEPKPA
ncbi:MAG: CaiB/BaiF CoA transferase family protein [Burkholderiaceae bacterium]